MFRAICKKLVPAIQRRNKRNVLDEIRRQVENSGYSVEHLTNPQLAAAVVETTGLVEPLTAKQIYLTLRRLSPDIDLLRNKRLTRA